MKLLRHPIRAIREPFGTAGLIVACVALIAALAGGAYAASGLNGKQKQEVTKIAKKESKKFSKQFAQSGPAGLTGPQGPKGDTGPKGDAGAAGTDGEDGVPGKNGSNGENVNITELDPGNGEGCEESGGAKFFNNTGVAFACNGEGGGGGGGGYPETLPSGRTMTGAWEVQGESGLVLNGLFVASNISFPLPLETAPTETILIVGDEPGEEAETKCPGNVDEPEAATSGVLCLYPQFANPEEISVAVSLLRKSSATLFFPKAQQAYGTWAVMAE
jgi:hypothetical protein